MITVAEAVQAIIKSSPLLEEGMSRGLLNISAVARDIAPRVAKHAKKEVSEGAVVMALKRLEATLPSHLTKEPVSVSTLDLIIRSSLIELTYRNSTTLTKQRQALLSLISDSHSEHFLTITTGVFETTIIASSALEAAIVKLLDNSQLIDSTRDLSSITVRLTPEMITSTGSIARILRQLAWENINLVEAVSTRQELTVIVSAKDADKAFAALHNNPV